MTDQTEIPFGQPEAEARVEAQAAPIGEIRIADRADAEYFGAEQIISVECENCGHKSPRDTFALEGCQNCGRRGGVQ